MLKKKELGLSCHNRYRQDRLFLALLEGGQNMQLVGQAVEHKAFGNGVVTNISNKIITICFSRGDKKFIYPDVFLEFLTLEDKSMQNEINSTWNKNLQEKNAQKLILQEEQEQRQRMRNMKITPNSQAAFHINGITIDEIITSGVVSSGHYLSGHSKGKPRIPIRLRPNSACLLTECPDNTPEQRKIVGVFMVKEDFYGEQCEDGMVKSHEQYKIALNWENGLKYLDYFDQNVAVPRWGSPVFKYFSNDTMQQILFDMIKVLSGSEEAPVINAFYKYFCEINRLPEIRRNA